MAREKKSYTVYYMYVQNVGKTPAYREDIVSHVDIPQGDWVFSFFS